jgi:hypothetical protein
MHVMGDAAGLVAGALDMREACAKHLIKRLLARDNTAAVTRIISIPPCSNASQMPPQGGSLLAK